MMREDHASRSRRRTFLKRVAAAGAVPLVTGCIYEKGEFTTTPSRWSEPTANSPTPEPTPTAKPMEPLNASKSERFPNVEPIEWKIHELTNKVRTEGGLSPMNTREGVPAVKYDRRLAYVARRYSKKMWDEEFFDHVSTDGNDAGDRLAAYNLADDYSYWAENIYGGGASSYYSVESIAETVVRRWENSDEHRENMRRSRVTHEGVGVFVTDEAIRVTQLLVQTAGSKESE
jgi:uncharacterized protein YkwD